MVPIGSKVIFLDLDIQRVACRRCDTIRQVELGFADYRFSYTRAFERYVLELSKRMTILDVARHLHVSWDTVKDIQKRYLKKRFSRPSLKDLRYLAIDEIAVKKGHHYVTVALDLESGAVIFVGDGKGADALEPFWKRLSHSLATVEAVAIDMSPAYMSAVMDHLPKAVIVFDHFHVVKLFNDKLSDLRRDLYREAKDQLHKDVLKGTRWLLLKNPGNLDEKKGEKERLEEALRMNQPLYTAYYLKEDLREVWTKVGQEAGGEGARRMDTESVILGDLHAQDHGEDPLGIQVGYPCLLRLPHLHRPIGGYQQQDQDHEAAGIRVSGHGVLQAEDHGPS
jgi:transposase